MSETDEHWQPHANMNTHIPVHTQNKKCSCISTRKIRTFESVEKHKSLTPYLPTLAVSEWTNISSTKQIHTVPALYTDSVFSAWKWNNDCSDGLVWLRDLFFFFFLTLCNIRFQCSLSVLYHSQSRLFHCAVYGAQGRVTLSLHEQVQLDPALLCWGWNAGSLLISRLPLGGVCAYVSLCVCICVWVRVSLFL